MKKSAELSLELMISYTAWVFSVEICEYKSGYKSHDLLKIECSHWWKIYFLKKSLQDLLSSLNAAISTNESTRFITGHVIYTLAYT